MPHYPALFALAHEPFICVDNEGRIAAVNQPAAQLLESTSAKLVGHAFADQVHPEDRERVATGVTRAAEDETMVEQACRLRCAGASYRAVVLRYGREPTLGQLVIAVRELTDLDELRQQRDDARRRLAAVFETMHDIVFTTDEHGVLNGVNRVPPGLTVADTIGTPMLAFAAPEEQEPMRARYDEVRETGKMVSYETLAIYPDGRKENYSSRLGPIMDGDRSIGVVLITRNITQERQAEEAKRYAEQQLRDYMQRSSAATASSSGSPRSPRTTCRSRCARSRRSPTACATSSRRSWPRPAATTSSGSATPPSGCRTSSTTC
ncbi:PAS domain-containing protein [Nannocystis pusilla]|uniref:PAS domain-containing protein n=1 Tax=Nannocystis pusilla TaxID=889268 RepID=A0A9X3F0R9_9BACT|nr:PAS domain-containing protein [Nannocystis pusilla]MCY1013897.1 PAS domain-containing protein [Nannocystis pusilla]